MFLSKKESLNKTGKMIVRIGKNAGEFLKNEIDYIILNRESYMRNVMPRIKYGSISTKDKIMETIE